MSLTTRLIALATVLLVLGAGVSLLALAKPFGDSENAPTNEAAATTPAFTTDTAITRLQQQIARRPDASSQAQLGSAYLLKARETGDPGYYTRADATFQAALQGDTNEPQAITGMGTLAMARHDFSGALVWAERASADDADTYGLTGDALIELGRYDEAFAAFQRMLDLRPDSSAYARVSYARELTGDLDGAVESMRQAVEATGPKGEGAAWFHVQLAHLYFITGDLDGAQAEYNAALDSFPGYVHGLAGLGRVAAARGDYNEAIARYSRAVERLPVLEYVVALGDVYHVAGHDEDANKQYELVDVIARLYKSNGVNTDLELAVFYADHDQRLDEAIRQARAEYQRRPSVQAADGLAWTLHKSGQNGEALRYSREALRLGTRDPIFLYRAGRIAQAAGEPEQARAYLSRALEHNPRFSVLYADDAEHALRELDDGDSLTEGEN